MNLSQLEYLRNFSKWLLVIPTAMFLLFSCGQLGILSSQKLAESNQPLPAGIDYGPWAYVLIHSSNSENTQAIFWGNSPSETEMDDPPSLGVSPESTVVILGIPTATDTQPLPSSTPPPTLTPTTISEFTATPTVESSPSATGPPTQFTSTPSNPGSNKFCDAVGIPSSYDDLHLHTANVKEDGFGTIIHALQIDEEETQVILERVTVTQNQGNARILEVVSVDWSHWGMGSTKIDVRETQAEITINPNLGFYACFAEGKCDHSLYGGEVYIDFEGELSGEYGLFVDIYFPKYDERCKLDLLITVRS